MAALPDELRLAITILLALGLLAAAGRLARRAGGSNGEPAHWLCDAMLLAFLAQYVVIGAAGMLGMLGPTSIAVGSAAAMAVIWWLGGRVTFPPEPVGSLESRSIRDPIPWSLCVVLAELAALIVIYLWAPVTANDALTYHLPAAAAWLQSGHINLYDVWFYNPANTYSPLAGSMFDAWYLGLGGNDVLARFVEIPALLLLWAASASTGLSLTATTTARGAAFSRGAVALGALAVVTARPFISQATLTKDDVYVAALFIAVVAALPARRLNDRLGWWRLGTAVGLLLATKYTALLSAPALLLALDAPWSARWRPRRWLAAAGLALLLAAPWYLRNALLTGNPVFPMDVSVLGHRLLRGMFTTQASAGLRGARQIIATFTAGYYGVWPPFAGALVLAWLLACGAAIWPEKSADTSLRDPVRRLILLGPPIGIGLFVAFSPFAAARFVGPALALLMLAPLTVASHWPRSALVASGVLAVMALFGGFVPVVLMQMAPYAAIVAAVLVALRSLVVDSPPHRQAEPWLAGALVTALALAALLYTQWPAYVMRRSVEQDEVFSQLYPDFAGAWAFVRDHTEADATIAYANFYYTYPLYGPALRHRVVYAPTRPGVHRLSDLPHLDEPVTGDVLYDKMVQITRADPDAQTWKTNLVAAGADYLMICMREIHDSNKPDMPPEAVFAARDPAHFAKLYDDGTVVVYRLSLQGLHDGR